MPSPAYEKSNPITQRIAEIAELNRNRPAGRSGPVLLDNGPSVQSAAMGREVEPSPLSPEEVERRNAEARKLGIKIEGDDEEENKYASYDEAIAVAGPVERPGPSSLTTVARARTNDALVRLPNFKRIYGYDLLKNVVVVDDIEFQLDAEDVRNLKAHAVEIALDAVVKQLASAYAEFGIPKEYIDNLGDQIRESVNGGSTTTGEGATEIAPSEPTGGTQSVPTNETGDSNEVTESGTEPAGVVDVVVRPIGQADTV